MLYYSPLFNILPVKNTFPQYDIWRPHRLPHRTVTLCRPLSSLAHGDAPHNSTTATVLGTVKNNVVPLPSISSASLPSDNAHSSTAPAPGSHTGSSNSGPHPEQQPAITSSHTFSLKAVHIFLFLLFFIGGGLVASLTLQFTAQMDFKLAVTTVFRRVTKSVAFRQLVVISCTILFIRFGLNTLLKAFAKLSATPVQWDKTKLYYVLREVYQPLELLLFIAGLCTISDSYVPQLISVPKATVSHVVKAILSVSFIAGASGVVYNLKSRFCKENAWQNELKGDITSQRRWEAYDKLGTFGIYAMTFVLGIQAMGLEVTSVLAIGGIGGLAIGLAGREICENLLNGFLIMSTNPFEVGDEVTFQQNGRVVEGLVMDIGWYRTLVRSFEREVYVIPNAVFSKNVVLNVSRKNREWRFYEMISLRVQDVHKAGSVIQDVRRIVRSDSRILNKLHKRVFLDKITHDDCKIYISFYVEASNRDAFMAIKQDLLLAFVDCVERNGAKLAMPRTVVDVDQSETLNASVAPWLSAASLIFNQQKAALDVAPVSPYSSVDLLPSESTPPQSSVVIASGQESKAPSAEPGNVTSTVASTSLSAATGTTPVLAGNLGGTARGGLAETHRGDDVECVPGAVAVLANVVSSTVQEQNGTPSQPAAQDTSLVLARLE